jgi:hypothetical protein
MAVNTETQIKNLQKRLEDSFEALTTKKNMTKIGKYLVADMQKRVRLGYGAPKQLGPRKSLKSLKDHSPEYKAYRKKKKAILDSTTRPGKQNLTFTGQLVRDLRLIKVTKANFIVGHSQNSRTGESLTNRDLSGFVQIKGRPYMNVTNLEFKRLLRFYQNEIIKPVLSKI